MKWEITYYSARLQEEILNLPEGILARYIALADRMETYGPNLGMPHTRAMGGGLFEIRAKGKEGIGRIFYCAIVGNRIVMLHCFVKKTEKTPPKELDMARKRLKEVKP
ncbi:MAG: type II toxin-antitoxin system RelE/ParE family toxin [Victivallales bacterium]|jgi:phage-related protein